MKNRKQIISCSFYDQLVLYASRRYKCEMSLVIYGKEQIKMGIIKDIYTKNGREFLILENDEKAIDLISLKQVKPIKCMSSRTLS